MLPTALVAYADDGSSLLQRPSTGEGEKLGLAPRTEGMPADTLSKRRRSSEGRRSPSLIRRFLLNI